MKVLLVVIDAASPRVFCPAVQTGRLRYLNQLTGAGSIHQASVSIFPSITPAATVDIAPICLQLLGIDVDTLCWQDMPRRRDPSC